MAPSETIEKLIPIIRHAGSILLSYRKSGFETNTKTGEEDLVTTADLKSEEYLCAEISRLFPADKILSEEHPKKFNDYRGRIWMIDPLDGTRAFVDGNESFSVMIGLAIDAIPVLGVMYAPVCDELYYAEKGKGAFLVKNNETKQIRVSNISDIKNARSVDYRRTNYLRALDEKVDRLSLKVVAVEGTNTLKIGKVAQGLADVVVNTNTGVSKWDFCAPQILLEEAGGRVSDIEGNPVNYLSAGTELNKSFVASNGHIHQQVIDAMNS